jgi:hypothetical protein
MPTIPLLGLRKTNKRKKENKRRLGINKRIAVVGLILNIILLKKSSKKGALK